MRIVFTFFIILVVQQLSTAQRSKEEIRNQENTKFKQKHGKRHKQLLLEAQHIDKQAKNFSSLQNYQQDSLANEIIDHVDMVHQRTIDTALTYFKSQNDTIDQQRIILKILDDSRPSDSYFEDIEKVYGSHSAVISLLTGPLNKSSKDFAKKCVSLSSRVYEDEVADKSKKYIEKQLKDTYLEKNLKIALHEFQAQDTSVASLSSKKDMNNALVNIHVIGNNIGSDKLLEIALSAYTILYKKTQDSKYKEKMEVVISHILDLKKISNIKTVATSIAKAKASMAGKKRYSKSDVKNERIKLKKRKDLSDDVNMLGRF